MFRSVEHDPAWRLLGSEHLLGQDLFVGVEWIVFVLIGSADMRSVRWHCQSPELRAAVCPRDLAGEGKSSAILEFNCFGSEGVTKNREQVTEPSLPERLPVNRVTLTVNCLERTRKSFQAVVRRILQL